MRHLPDRSPTRRDTLLLTSCVVLSGAALVTPTSFTQSLANTLRATALRPVVWMQERALEGRTSRSRFEAVEAARDTLALRVLDRAVLQQENDRLRRLLDLGPRVGMPFVGAEVLHQPVPTDGRTLLLSVGREDGVRPYDIVLVPEGLLGIVAEVGPRSSIANTWAHPEFRVSGVTAEGAVLGVVAPGASTLATDAILEFRGVAYRDTLDVGTVVVSAGLGDVYPRGIPIGQVIGIRQEQPGWERVYALRPLVNPGVVSHVLVARPARATSPLIPGDSGGS